MSSALGTCIGWLRGWFDNHSLARASHHTQLVLTALLSGGIVAATIVTFQSDRRRRLVALLKASIPEAEQDPIATKVPSRRYTAVRANRLMQSVDIRLRC